MKATHVETPREHIGNALQILAAFAFLHGHERAGDAGLQIVSDAAKRLQAALKQLDKVERWTR